MTIFSQAKTLSKRAKRFVFTRADFAGYGQAGKAFKRLVDGLLDSNVAISPSGFLAITIMLMIPNAFADDSRNAQENTSTITFNFQFDQLVGDFSNKTLEIRLTYLKGKALDSKQTKLLQQPFNIKPAPQITIPNLAVGQYYVQMWMSGAAFWTGSPFELNDQHKKIDVVLQPGRDLTAQIRTADTNKRPAGLSFTLGGDNAHALRPLDLSQKDMYYKGLGLGEYKLIIDSSPNYHGQVIDITLDESSDDIVDLGVIQLSARSL